MIDRQFGCITFICDECDEDLPTDEEDFDAAMAVFRRHNWRSEKVGDEWVHTCQGCR